MNHASLLRLLVVDDSPANRTYVDHVLERLGLEPATMAMDGEQALRLVQGQDFDLVLMDILMPVMDGLVATARIRQLERDTPSRTPLPIVAYTSLDLDSDPARLRRSGLSDVLAKPCSTRSLRQCLQRWCPEHLGPLEAAPQAATGQTIGQPWRR